MFDSGSELGFADEHCPVFTDVSVSGTGKNFNQKHVAPALSDGRTMISK